MIKLCEIIVGIGLDLYQDFNWEDITVDSIITLGLLACLGIFMGLLVTKQTLQKWELWMYSNFAETPDQKTMRSWKKLQKTFKIFQ